MKIKKILTVLGSALMIGSTMGMAVAANYPSPFAPGTSAVVYGANEVGTDSAAAILIGSDIGNKVGGGSAPVVDIGDESFKIAAPGNDLSFDQSLSAIRETVTKTQLPTLLADGSIRDTSSRKEYTQSLNLGDHKVTYGSLGEAEDYVVNTDLADDERPVLYLNQPSNEAWELVVEFDEAFNASAVRDSEELVIAGKSFTVSPDLDSKLVLFASTETLTPTVGESTTVEIDGVSYTIEVVGANTETETATIKINGQQFQIEAGDTEWVGDQKFYINRVFMQTIPESSASVEIFAGADEIEIQGTSYDEVDLNGEALPGVEAKITGSVGAITEISFKFIPSDLDLSTDDAYYLEIGESIVDPLFGTIQMAFDSASMELKDADKELIDFSRSGADLEMTFKNINGNEYELVLLTDDENGASAELTFHENYYHENTVALGRYNITILNEGSSTPYITRLVQMTTRNPADNEKIVFEDLSTGDSTTAESGDQLWTTGAYAVRGNLTLTNSTGGTDNTLDYFNWTRVDDEDDAAEGWWLTTTALATGNNTSVSNLYDETTIYAMNNAEIRLASTSAGTSSVVTIAEDSEDSPVTHVVNMTADNTGDGEFDINLADRITNLTGGTDDESDMGYYLSDFGTYVEEDRDDNDQVTFWIPADEVTYNIYVSSLGETNTPDETGVIAYKDTETASYAGKHLVVVGGSCINSLAAELLGGALCESDFTDATGVEAGQFLIQSFSREGKTALLVAGYNAADTTKGANALVDSSNTIVTDVGTKYVSSSETVGSGELVSA